MENQMSVTPTQNATTESNQPGNTGYEDLLRSAPGTSPLVKPTRSLQTIQKKAPTLSFLSMESWKTAHLSRRQIMVTGLFAAASLILGLGNRDSWATTPYTKTIKFLQLAHKREIAMYGQYVEFGRKAKVEGYRGIAYLCAAFATAELIHAQNFAKILSRLDVEIVPVSKAQMTVSSTRDNLMKAANDEIDDIDSFYPDMIKQVNPEGVQDVITFATFAWKSEKQHRDVLMKIQRWAPWFFEKVAKTIDEKTDQYFVCQICGSTMDEIPPGKCPICHFSVEHYRKIEYPT
jgi:rubrerythrin